MPLTDHFSLSELTRSEVAVRHGLVNAPNAAEASNLFRLCTALLEPARELLGVPLHINSGYRSPEVNRLVGGKAGSAHLDGRAADFVPVGMNIDAAFVAIRDSALPYDQVILEYGSWIHLAVARAGVDPRRQALVIG